MGGTGISFIFGTVTAAHNTECIGDLRRHLDNRPRLAWMRETTDKLTEYWDLLINKVPSINGSFPGRQILADFNRWLRQGFNPGEEPEELGNTVLLPLVAIVGLTEFWEYVESTQSNAYASCEDPLQELLSRYRDEAKGSSSSESIGLCAGMLTAFAVASSHSRAEFEQYGAAAIRLSMMVGAVLDAQDAWHGAAKSYVASWRTAEQGEQLQHSIDLVYPQAYLSVLYDERRVTITTTAQWIRSTILRQLQGAGLTVAESSIQGRPHCPDSESKKLADAVCDLAKATPELQLADMSGLALRTYANEGNGDPIQHDSSLHEVALRSSLATQCSWYETFASLPLAKAGSSQAVVSFGPDRCVPPSLVATLGKRWTHVSELSHLAAEAGDSNNSTSASAYATTPAPAFATPAESDIPSATTTQTHNENLQQQLQHQEPTPLPRAEDHTIAVVGMSLKTAGADDVEEFSRMIQSGVSQHELIRPERLKFHTLWRQGDWDPSYKWYANWMRDVDKFDHQFFKKSPREAANMDPQQRLALQAAYQALEKAGYYTTDSAPGTTYNSQKEKDHIGVYVGITLDDYQSHVRSHRANAFCITGTMRSLIAGKVAHHFGFTGPAMTVDTACSSSAVAIHNACRDLLAGDCNAALAGGANVITDPLAFQDLAAAGFLSPTGQCKPFDDAADGYCRGEAVGFVVLKRLSDALADGNQILGCISSSAVYQNENHTPIFVPNSPSLSDLFRHVLKKAQVEPSEITAVECHGTGTPVGDPAEWEGVHEALEVSDRSDPIYIGSAKGHIGHTEAASGVVAFIKVLTMLQGGHIPPQASHTRLNHLIQPSDTMKIASSQQLWSSAHKKILFNNYGASGSNVAMIVTESSTTPGPQKADQAHDQTGVELPFCIAGRTASSVMSNCARLLAYLSASSSSGISLADLSFNMHRQFNRALPYRFPFKSSSLDDLRGKLFKVSDKNITSIQPSRKVILCFGGQVSTAIGLDRNLYASNRILRHYLDKCDATIRSFGLASIYPDIFSQEAIQDPQHLQLMLFATQYSCAMSWLQSGLSGHIAAVVGHSFGELTALCISGALTLYDTVKLVAGRAKLIRDLWGPDPGAMLALEADEGTVNALLSKAQDAYPGPHPASIACYNGPRSFTVAGGQQAIKNVSELISELYPSIRSKTLRVTNAFHSSLVGPLEQDLELLGEELGFQKPRIPLERTTQTHSSTEAIGPSYVAEQMRKPVFFRHAVQRLAEGYPDCVWLEAGSTSTVTVMAQRALAESAPKKMSHHFQSIKITDSDAFNKLSEATVTLWKAGVPTSFWAHNAIQTPEYATLILPPYQFEKERHWVELRDPFEFIEQIKESVRAEQKALMSAASVEDNASRNAKWIFTGYGNSNKKQPVFRINTAAQEYQDLVRNHVVANTAGIASGMYQVDLAVGALFSIHPEWSTKGLRATLLDMTQYAPVCLDASRVFSVEFEEQGADEFWDWRIVGRDAAASGSPTVYTIARFQIRDPADAAWQAEFRRLGRLVDHARCAALFNMGPLHEDVHILQGNSIYQAFEPVVDFGTQYRSLRWLVSRGNESAGRISRTPQNDTWFDSLRGEHISQVGGVWVNCLTEHNAGDIYVGSQIEIFMISPDWAGRPLPRECDALARRRFNQDTGDYMLDTFIFDPESGELVEVLLGVRFTKTPVASFTRALQRMTPSTSTKEKASPLPQPQISPVSYSHPVGEPKETPTATTAKPETATTSYPRRSLLKEMGEVVAELVGIEVTEIGPDANLADFGIDSLLGMELLGEIKTAFECEPDEVQIMGATTLRELVRCLPIAGASDDAPEDAAGSTSTDSFSFWSSGQSDGSSASTSTPPNTLWEPADIFEAFASTKARGDEMIKAHGLDNFHSVIIPESNRMCAALVVECFEALGCPLSTAKPGQTLHQITFEPQHKILVSYIYNFLDKSVDLLSPAGDGQYTRTSTPVPNESSQDILDALVAKYPLHDDFHRLTHHAGKHLADALRGKTDGNRILMGDPEGRRLCQSVYHSYAVNRIGFETMRDVLERVTAKINTKKNEGNSGPLRILELGGGTASATTALLPLLAKLHAQKVPVEYTFTDLSTSLVAQARRTLGKQYPFMKFTVQDIEKPVPSELSGKQHIVIASHCVHATRSLTASTRNIRGALAPEGFLMMFEMREAWPALDLPFGLYEGWWLFEDGRSHAYTDHRVWERCLTDAGYGGVRWTEGEREEHRYHMVVVASRGGFGRK